MPLLSISGADAIRTRKINPHAGWGVRGEENRIEPFTRPAFDAPFRFEPGERIFTIGSCFARNVETELARRGFGLPMHDLFRAPAFEGLAPWYVNNYGAPSIYNEFAWAFGEEPFIEADAFVELGDGRYYDLSLHHGLRPGPLEEVRARRAALTAAIGALAECRVMIMTLGLVELWWDAWAKRYLNTIPLPSILALSPDRFELHVLSFAESLDYLERALALARKHGHKDLRIILTVSPVPLMSTYRPADVVVANCYSKSVLRAATEHVVIGDERVVYFPSYESVTHSDRRLAWSDDFVHVTQDIVAFNVDRLVNAFSGEPERVGYGISAELDTEVEPQGAVAMIEAASKARAAGDRAFFDANAEWSRHSQGFLIEYARFLDEQGEHAGALALLGGSDRPGTRMIRAEIELAAGDFTAAIATVRPLCAKGTAGQKQWRLLLDAIAKSGEPDDAIAVEREWLDAAPYLANSITFQVARTLYRLGDIVGAAQRFRRARPHFAPSNGYFAMESAPAFLDAGMVEEARVVLAHAEGKTSWQNKRLTHLRERVAVASSETRDRQPPPMEGGYAAS